MVQRGLVTGALALMTLGLLGATGCKPKEGDPCEKGKAVCLDGKTELSCQDGKLLAAPCKGPKGCATAGNSLTCDISANGAGDICSADDDGAAACSTDNKSMVVCEKGKYAVHPCRGPKACKEGTKVDCDESVAEVGDACTGAGYKCSGDRKSLLQCKEGKAALDEKCPEGQTCKDQGNEVGCAQ